MITLGKLTGRQGDLNELYTHNGRVYNDNVLKQVKNFNFMENGGNVSVFGSSGVGKSYLLVGIAIEACRRGYKTYYADFCDLLNLLDYLKKKNIISYEKKVNYFSRITILIIDDFLSSEDCPASFIKNIV